MEDLKWEQKDKPNITNLLEQMTDATKQVVANEIKSIYSKIEILHSMGLIEDDKKMKELKERMAKLNFEDLK